MVENVNALALLKEEMQTEEIHLKVNAIHRLKTVILSIGINETNTQLIPYLDSKFRNFCLHGLTEFYWPYRYDRC